jgi:hypothetical protein
MSLIFKCCPPLGVQPRKKLTTENTEFHGGKHGGSSVGSLLYRCVLFGSAVDLVAAPANGRPAVFIMQGCWSQNLIIGCLMS